TRTYTATEMARQYQGITTFDEGAGEAFVEKMEAAVRSGLDAILSGAFPAATRTITTVDGDEASLTAARSDAHDPPIRVRFAATIERSREEAGLAGLSDAAVEAVFAAGGRVQTTLPLSADPGYALTYVLHAPQRPVGLAFSQLSTGAVAMDGSTVTLALDNARGRSPLVRTAALHLLDPAAASAAPTAESISTVIDVRLGALTAGAASVPLEADVAASLRAVGVEERFPGALPPGVTLDHASADALRALRAAGAIGDADLARADAAFLSALDADLAATMGEGARATGGLDRADLAKPAGAGAPVVFRAAATGAYALPGERVTDADLALAIGGTVRLRLSLASGSGETTYRLHPPPGTQFVEPRGGTASADGLTATFVVPTGEAPRDVGVSLRQSGVAAHAAEDARLAVLVDLKDVDVSLGDAMGGDFGSVLVDVTIRGELGVIRVPDGVKAGLGDALDLEYLSSDGIRLLLDRGVLPPDALGDLEVGLLDEVAANLRRAMGTDVAVTGGFEQATLDKGRVSTPASGEDPIVFTARASFQRPLSGGSQAALALYSVPQAFTFPRVRDLDTTYTVVLPRGLAVTSLEATNGEATTGEWTDGRQAFTVRPTDDQAETRVTMAVTPSFVLFKFWPLVLGAVVLLVLAVGTPIALVVLRRRKA
ncbi:MAG TPA: hypothetical protein VNX21_08570, partial [Candidatus Thermoplasmatota archaeon]|nr:hypothetical protein [Candidatus Thermoplasmatota archaeon]